MTCDLQSLEHLEALLTEFYSPIADNAKKKEIDKILTDFCKQPSAWKSCLFYISNTRNDHVLMFCLKVFEIAVSQQCENIGAAEKEMIRLSCYHMLMSGTTLSFFIRNKLMKLIVTIARVDWPQNYPSFLDEINHLLSNEDQVLLGLNFLIVTSEEFGSSKEDVSSGRKRQLSEAYKSNIPHLLLKVAGILKEVRIKVDLHSNNNNSASTTNGFSSETSGCVEGKWLNVFKYGLECTTCLLGWFEPQKTEEETSFLQLLFSSIVELSSHFLVDGGNGLHCCSQQCRFQVGEMALSCICDVLSLRLCPKLFGTTVFPHLLTVSLKNVMHLLSILVNESQNIWSYLSEGRYLSRLIDYLHLFIKNHLKNFEVDQEFFQLLIKFTFEQQPYSSLYLPCLAMWSDFFELLSCQKLDRFQGNGDVESRYKDITLEVTSKVLAFIQFKNNHSHLQVLDDDVLDDDFKTEWQHYLLENIEVILRVSKLHFNEVMHCLNQPFELTLVAYFGLGGYITNFQNPVVGGGARPSRRLVMNSDNDCKKLHCMLRDLSTFLQIFSNLVDNFTGYEDRKNLGCIIFQRLLSMMDYSAKMRFYEVDSTNKNALEADFIEVHAQILAAVKAWIPFLNRVVPTSSSSSTVLGGECDTIVPSILHSLLPLFQIEMLPEKILLSASQLLLSFVSEIKPPLVDPSFHRIFSDGIAMATAPPKAVALTYRALFWHLLTSAPPPRIDNSHDDQNLALMSTFCCFLFKDFSDVYKEAVQSEMCVANNESANHMIQKTMETMADIIISLSGMTSRKLECCYSCLVQFIGQAVDLLGVFINKRETSSKIMGFFWAVIQTFRSQMGCELIRNILDRFMVLFSKKLIVESLGEEESSGHELLEKLLKIFETLVKDGSAQSRSLLPVILDLCLNRIHPVVSVQLSLSLKPAIFSVFFSTLKSNWGCFFPSTILQNSINKQLIAKNSSGNELQYQHFFIQMMTAYHASLSQSDIELAKQVLDQLEALNKQFKLYSKPAFRDQFLPRFFHLLTSDLVYKVHELLQEEVTAAIFNMAAVDFGLFYNSFIPQLLASFHLGDDRSMFLIRSLNSEEDLLSFTTKMSSFVGDLRYFVKEANALNASVMGPTL